MRARAYFDLSQNIVELAACKPLANFSEVCDAAAMIQAQIYREWGAAIAKGRVECLLARLECSVPDASPPRSEKRGDGVCSRNAVAAIKED